MTTTEIKEFYAQASRWAFPFLLIMVVVAFFTCNKERDERMGLAERLDILEARTVQIENERGQLVAQNDQLLTKNAAEIERLTDTIFNLKRKEERLIKEVTAYTRIVQDIRFRDKEAVFIDRPIYRDTGKTVYLPQPADTGLIRVPRPFEYQDSTITFAGVVRKTGVKIDSLAIPNTLHFRTVIQKTGFLNLGRKTVVQAINSNPAITNSGVASVAVKPAPNWWNRWGKPLVAAAVSGFVVYKVRSQ